MFWGWMDFYWLGDRKHTNALDKNNIQPQTMGGSISICNAVNIFTVISVNCILRWWSGCIYEDKCHIFGKTWVTQDCQTMECKGNKWSFRNGILRKGGFSNSHLRKPTNLLNVCLRMLDSVIKGIKILLSSIFYIYAYS